MTPDAAAILADAAAQMAAAYHYAEYRGDIQSHIYLLAATGTPLEEAARKAYAWADKERKGDRGCVSWDALRDEFGDAIAYLAVPCPTQTRQARDMHEKRAGGKATPRVREMGIEELGEVTLDHLISVIRNLCDRNALDVDPLTCAIDVRGLSDEVRRAAIAVLSSVTKAEMKEAGISGRCIREAVKVLRSFAPRLRTDLL